ncbi:MAG: hypothetical protein IRZ00_13285 [Gemmatimonadetes bacterium]|nr:hypothetical protein [Gemmatimonadota bacterium]
MRHTQRPSLVETLLEGLALEQSLDHEVPLPMLCQWAKVRGFPHKTADAITAAVVGLERAGLVYMVPPERTTRRRTPARVGLTRRAVDILRDEGPGGLYDHYVAHGGRGHG